MFAPKGLRPSEILALRTLIGGRTGIMPQTLEGRVEELQQIASAFCQIRLE